MIKLLNLLITVPVSLFVLLFAVSNTQDVEFTLNFVDYSATLPLYVVSLGLMGFGFLVGCFLVWLNLYKFRIKFWQSSRKNTKLEDEIERLKGELDEIQNAPKLPHLAPEDEDARDDTPASIAYYDR